MINPLLSIFQCCDLIRDLNNEFNKPFGWLKIKEKREYKKLKNQVINMIDNLIKDTWTVEYLFNLEKIFILYWDRLEKYSEDISITKDILFWVYYFNIRFIDHIISYSGIFMITYTINSIS